MLQVWVLAQDLSDFCDTARAIHLWHRVVHEDELVERPSVYLFQSCLDSGDGVLAIVSQVRDLAKLPKQTGYGKDVEVVVIHDEDRVFSELQI